jgi:hypothetical protein
VAAPHGKTGPYEAKDGHAKPHSSVAAVSQKQKDEDKFRGVAPVGRATGDGARNVPGLVAKATKEAAGGFQRVADRFD